MNRLLVVCCLLVLLILVFPVKFSFKYKENESSFSPVAANPTNLIDIRNLHFADYLHVFEESGAVFVKINNSQKQVYFNDKQLQSFVLSHSPSHVAFTYYPDEPNDQILSLVLLSVDDKSTKEIFQTPFPSWDITSNPMWLGSNHLVFLRHCGTACQGLSLLDVRTGEVKNAILSYQSFSDQPLFTHFKDWFGGQFQWEGSLMQIKTESKGNNNYLVFVLQNESGVKVSEEVVQFHKPGQK